MNQKFLCALAGLLACTSFTPLVFGGDVLDCDELPSPVYGLGANAVKPLFKRLGQGLSSAASPETIVYQAPGQCVGINGLLAGTDITGTAIYWDETGTELTCTLPITGVPVEFAAMNSTAALCPGVGDLPDDIGVVVGPTQSFDFIVPKASSQTSISAAAAYFVYGFGSEGEAEPWTDESQIFRRDANAGPALFTALALGIPVDKLKGVDAVSNANTVTLVSTAPDPEKAIGIVAGEIAAANTDVITSLAYQHFDQECGYYPNSTETSTDKRNIRDGHYWLWSPIHFFAEVDGSGVPTVPGVARLLGYFNGSVEVPENIDFLDLQILAGTVPECAMTVRRDGDLGDLQSFLPEEPCGCHFESIATGTSACDVCDNNDDCAAAAPNCRFGYCEVN
jgi:hypothetical protein